MTGVVPAFDGTRSEDQPLIRIASYLFIILLSAAPSVNIYHWY